MVSAVVATAAMPVPNFVLAEPGVVVPSMPVELGTVRTLAEYDINLDRFVVRIDVFNGRNQWGVDFWVANAKDASSIRRGYLENRSIAEGVLQDSLIHENVLASDLIALPLPPGYKEPAWMSG